MGTAAFADRLVEAIARQRTPVAVGIDPEWEKLPSDLRRAAIEERGETLAAVALAYERFAAGILDRLSALIPIVKFQSAFFEAAGLEGLKALHASMRLAKEAGLLIVLDGKRNDIGNTAAAYASAYLGPPPLGSERAFPSDAATVNPYLGAEGLEPFLQTAKHNGTGVFVLVRTSNPGAGALQDLVVGERTVYQTVGDWVEAWSASTKGESGYGVAGAVVGATVPQQIVDLRKRMPHVVLLLPGYGAQGGTAADAAPAFDSKGFGALVSNSRGILYAYQSAKYAGKTWQDASVAATKDMIADLAAHTPAGTLL
jgi:orotidine-5'-phosphate decarboxylase